MKSLSILLSLVSTLAFAGEISFDLKPGRLTLDEQGHAGLDLGSSAPAWPTSLRPAFVLHTTDAALYPQTVTSTNDSLTVTFPRGYVCEFSVAAQPGLLLFDLTRFAGPENVERLELFSLTLPAGAEPMPTPNGGRTPSHVVTLSAAELNVHAYNETHGRQDADRAGCTHEFIPTDEAKQGSTAARFTSTCNEQALGWSFVGRAFPRAVDLTGCRAIRAWIHGDGKGEQLKIQLYDGQGGYRDTYFPIDFEGWRQVTIADSPLNTLKADQVAALNLYYNGVPANETVTCLVDGVEALVERGTEEKAVLLEDFERTTSEYWAEAVHSIHVETVKAHGLRPARFGLLVCERDRFAETMQRFEVAAGLPSPRPGGVWSKQSPWVDRSYLFITGFSEALYDTTLAMAKRGGFDMILILQDSWTKSTGKYEVNTDAFPGGLDALVATVNRFKKEGFKVGLHFLGASIYPNDPYLTPVPDKRLVRDASAQLAADIDANATVIPTTAPPDAFPAVDGGYMGNGTIIQIGDELISYGERTLSEPFGFQNAQRGFHGTVAAPHAKGDVVRHLHRSYGYYLYDMDTSLIDEVSTNMTKIANACDVDMLYFDGSEWLQGDYWYYNAKLHKTFFDKLNRKDILLQASGYSHYSWHILARTASADGHGDLKGYLDQRSPAFDAYARDLMPLDVGWYYGYDPTATPDMFEYVLGKTIGYDSSMSFQVSPAAAANHPFTGEILDLIHRYETLRLSGRVSKEMKERLYVDPALAGREPGDQQAPYLDRRREYRLLGPEGHESFQRVIYTPWHDVSPADEQTRTWTFNVPEGGAKIGIQFHLPPGPSLAAGPSYTSSDAVTLESFDSVAPYQSRSTKEGVTQTLEVDDKSPREGAACAVYSAESGRTADDGWSYAGRSFDAPVDLSWHKCLGFWMRGDGNGGQFKLQLTDGAKAADYYIPNDFVGWRYQQLPRPENDPIDFTQVRGLGLYFNGLPGGKRVACAVDGLKALRAFDAQTLAEPRIDIGGRAIALSRSLQAGQYAFLYPDEPWRFYGPKFVEPSMEGGEVSAELPQGEHSVHVSWSGSPQARFRARVVLQTPERYEIAP